MLQPKKMKSKFFIKKKKKNYTVPIYNFYRLKIPTYKLDSRVSKLLLKLQLPTSRIMLGAVISIFVLFALVIYFTSVKLELFSTQLLPGSSQEELESISQVVAKLLTTYDVIPLDSRNQNSKYEFLKKLIKNMILL